MLEVKNYENEKEQEEEIIEDFSDRQCTQSTSLPIGWEWIDYDDGSGHLQSPDQKSYFSYDTCTQEYIHPNDEQWHFMNNYPERTYLKDFKKCSENWIKRNILTQKKDIENDTKEEIEI